MTDLDFSLTRRSALFAAVASSYTLFAGEKQVITRIQPAAVVQVGSSTFKRRDLIRKFWTPGPSMR
jgi:hypothetical protein